MLYQIAVALAFTLILPFLLLYVFVSGHHRRGLAERLGYYHLPDPGRRPSHRVWIHAASIGEVKAARVLVDRFRKREPESFFILTCMTIHGRDFARNHMGADIVCVLAPLDIPLVTDCVVRRLNPDVYVCLETELWPLLIWKIKKRGTAAVLLNGRLSDRSIGRYRRLCFLFGRVLRSFDRIGVIGETDRERFLELGADPGRVSVTGNVKHDSVLPGEPDAIRNHWRKLLALCSDTSLFAAASTHAPEETLLIPLYERFTREPGHLWLIAPRHLDRIGEIERMLFDRKIPFDLLSDCKQGKTRRHSLLLVDTFGDLSDLYSVVSSVFIGGSLVDRGGHNPLEAAIWNKAVIFGPYMQDFNDAAGALEREGGGFRIRSVAEIERLLQRFAEDPTLLETAGTAAGAVAARQRGAADLQAELIHLALRGHTR